MRPGLSAHGRRIRLDQAGHVAQHSQVWSSVAGEVCYMACWKLLYMTYSQG